jgi:hypothetical protein
VQYLKAIYPRYAKATRAEKQEILNEFCKNCHYNRKYAIRLLNGYAPQKRRKKISRKREPIYDSKTIWIIENLWRTSGYLWSHRIKAAIPLWMPWLKERFPITSDIEQQLLSISSSTIDRRLRKKKIYLKKKLYGSTKPGSLLKNQIPIKIDRWDTKIPGFLEIDLVDHCGTKSEGTFIHSLNCVDIHTCWVETRAIMGKGRHNVLNALKDIKQSLPFDLRGIDSDNGSEFINYHLKKFCDLTNIQFTRGRAYNKNDNAHIEQKNWTHVRKIFGYTRLDNQEVLKLMNELCKNELNLFQNFFQPSVKLIKKIRIGSRYRRVYDNPQTPFQRVCQSDNVNSEKLKQLKYKFTFLDPFILSRNIQRKLSLIIRIAHTRADKQRKAGNKAFALSHAL